MISMGLYVIGSLIEWQNGKEKTVGYKILSSKTGKYQLLSEKTISSQNLSIENAEFVDGVLKGTQGDLSRYTKINVEDGMAHHGNSAVILGKNEEDFYLVVLNPEQEDNLIRHMSLYELKRSIRVLVDGTDTGIKAANARIDNINAKDLSEMKIKPIKGKFEVIEKCPKYLENIFECKNLNGKESKWRVRVVKPKEKYGREYSLVNNSKSSLVEFYDMTKNIEKFPLGQYVASYNYETLRDSNKGGLHLNGDSSSWYIETNEYNKILEWLNSLNL